MASLQLLWKQRAKFPVGSKPFFKAWAKRFLTSFELFKRNYRKKKLIKSGASIEKTAEIGNIKADGNKRKLSVGNFSFLGEIYLALYDDIIIGERVCINDGVKILTGSHDISDPEWKHIKKKVIIEDYAWVGMNAIILPGVSIGRGGVVGAGAVVTKSVPSGGVVVGNPAQLVKKTRATNLRYNPCLFLACNNAWLIG